MTRPLASLGQSSRESSPAGTPETRTDYSSDSPSTSNSSSAAFRTGEQGGGSSTDGSRSSSSSNPAPSQSTPTPSWVAPPTPLPWPQGSNSRESLGTISTPPAPACPGNRTFAPVSGPCSSPSSLGFVVGGMILLLAALVLSVSMLLHFWYNTDMHRSSRHPDSARGQGEPAGPAPGHALGAPAPPIAVQAVGDADESLSGGRPPATEYTKSVCVRLPGQHTALLIAWPECTPGKPKAHQLTPEEPPPCPPRQAFTQGNSQ